MPRVIAVSGMMGSGKTTLAKNVARQLRWRFLPEARTATSFLPDLFRDQGRWAFDAQVAFVAEKALQLAGSSRQGLDVVLDRSLSEDVEVFGQYFVDHKYMDARSAKTYTELARHFLDNAPKPDIIVYCECSVETVARRIAARGREYQQAYPEGHLLDISGGYSAWLNRQPESLVMRVNSETVDFRDPGVVAGVVERIVLRLGASRTVQAELFLSSQHDLQEPGPQLRRRDHVAKPSFPYAYIAAPFTGHATTTEAHPTDDSELFATGRPHGVIPQGRYRRALTELAKRLERMGVHALLPHRDVNRWGRKILNAQTVVGLCTEHVRGCDLFIAVLGESIGSHYEFGLARALAKPCILIRCKEIGESFIASGVQAEDREIEYKCDAIQEIPRALEDPAVQSFLRAVLP